MTTSLEELRNRFKTNQLVKEQAREKLIQYAVVPTAATETNIVAERDELEEQIISVIESESLEANAEQIKFIKLCVEGKNCILIGPAGTGKTTAQGINAHVLQHLGKLPPLQESTKHLKANTPGIVICSFTNKAVNNIRWKMSVDLQANCITIHKLLEFKPVWYEVENEEKPGEYKKTVRFEPQRNKYNPLPASLTTIVIEESSTVGTGLYSMLLDACPHNPQIILLGDLYQLPPIYEDSILGYKLLDWPVVELVKIFRQAAESPIISFAWDIKNGVQLSSNTVRNEEKRKLVVPAFEAKNVPGKLHIRQWQKKLTDTEAILTATKFFTTLHAAGEYDPDEDIILIPFNKAVGSIELNNGIAQYLGKQRKEVVHEVIAGFKKQYIAIGDKVLYQKEDYYIEDITVNGQYIGKPYQKPSLSLDRWGHQVNTAERGLVGLLSSEADFDQFLTLSAAANSADDDMRTTIASHTIRLRRAHDSEEVELSTAGEVNNLLGGYVLTIHKAQGSEWKRVFCIFHHSHATMLSRELLYTAVTRARESLYIICEANTFEQGVKSQRIKGTTLAEKAEYFKNKQDSMQEGQKEKISPRMVSVQDLVSQENKDLAEKNLALIWTNAEQLFSNRIGKCPSLSFNLARKSAIGLANYSTRQIKLNAVYLAAGDEELKTHMLYEVIIHEVCHFVAARTHKEYGHGFWWKQAMVKFGVPANRICPLSVPPYLQSKVTLIDAKFMELRGTRDETPVIEGEQE